MIKVNQSMKTEAEVRSSPIQPLPIAMTVAGSDSGGGAGIQADLLTFCGLKVFGTSAITCLTAQNPDGVAAIEVMSPAFVLEQIKQVKKYFPLNALKTGMLFDVDIIMAVASFLQEHRKIAAVIDPVMVATSGAELLHPDAVQAIKDKLLPLATVTTPNLDEVNVLLGKRPTDRKSMIQAAEDLVNEYQSAALVKGGHMEGEEIVDILYETDGSVTEINCKRIKGINTHGSGCTLSAAIAAELAKGNQLKQAVEAAHAYLQRGMRSPRCLQDQSFIGHGG